MEPSVKRESVEVKHNQAAVAEIKARLEASPYGKKPIDQWTYEEKAAFYQECGRLFNNLRDNIRGALSVKETASEDDEMNSYMDETVLVVYFGGNEQEMKESINLGESSEIFTNHTHRDFLKTIKKALINGGVDVVRLKELLDKDRVFDRKQFDEPSSFVREPPYNDLYKEYLDFKTEFYSSIIPVVFDLLENYGYTRYELER